jgi:hypothetical protein
MGQMTDRMMVARWLAGYEAAWRSPGTDGLAEIFTDDAVYLHSPTRNLSRAWTRSCGCGAPKIGNPP